MILFNHMFLFIFLSFLFIHTIYLYLDVGMTLTSLTSEIRTEDVSNNMVE